MPRLPFLFLIASIASTAVHADPPAMSGAFTDGANFGRDRNTTTQANIKSGAAAANVPHAASSAPEAGYFGAPGLGAPASARATDCGASSLDPNAYGDQPCAAINFSQTNPARRPQFTLHPTDPIFANTRSVLNDPAAIAANIAFTYSGCTTQTVKTPDIFQTQVCNEYRTLEHNTCAKTLIVTVTDEGLNCNYGTYLTPNARIVFIRPFVLVGAICAEDIRFQWTWTFSECNGTDALQYMTTVIPSDDYQVIGVSMRCGGAYNIWGSCPGGNCSYSVGSVSENFVCDQYEENTNCDDYRCEPVCIQGHNEPHYYPLAGFSFQRPVHAYSTTDSWDNQCTAFEARLP